MKRLLRFAFLSACLGGLLATAGCMKPIEAISLSNTSYDFGLNTLPFSIQVWNNNPDASPITIKVTPDKPWIRTDVTSVTSNPPSAAGGPFDKKGVRITIDRNQLNKGSFDGTIQFSANNVVSKSIAIHVESDQDHNGAPLNVLNVETKYQSPYLVEFSYALRDANGGAVVAEPSQFTLTAQEGADPVTFETGLHLRRAAARQLKADLLLDYALTMQSVPGAIAAMEDAAKNVFLTALNSDAQVGVTEFHTENLDAGRVADFTTDREFLRQRINSIQSEFVRGFASFARIYDSIVQSAEYFDGGDGPKEDRYIVLFTDGNDTSSTATANDAVDACESRNIKIYTVGVGANVDELTLTDLSTRTGGVYFPASTADQLSSAFTKVVNDLEAQYTVRWASGKRTGSFFPEFTLGLGGASATFRSDKKFTPTAVAGDTLQGKLFFAASDNTQESTVFLRADYIPRNIHQLILNISSPLTFAVSKVEAGEDGLVGDWNMQITNTKATSVHIVLTAPDSATLPFATFGPLLRLEFQEVFDRATLPFDSVTVDNTIYQNGQHFVVQGF